MKHIYIAILLVLGQHLAAANENNTLLAPSATISGGATVCQNAASPVITFTGSGGTAPYTFTYHINTGGALTISSTGTNSSVTLPVSTANFGTFTYNLDSVHDSVNPTTEEPITSQTAVFVINPQPNANMGGTGSGSTFGGFPVFRVCSNTASAFSFTNTSTSSATNTNYTISWGDGSPNFTGPNWTTLSHTYQVGIWYLNYTINGSNGCSITKIYVVFVGSNPAVSLGNPGNTDICNANSLTFPITGTTNNPPGTTYTVTFNDSSTPQVFSHPPPSSVTHTFTRSSCGTTSSDGSNTYPNSFSANIVATNPCSTSSVGVVPIYVSENPQANFTGPVKSCTGAQACFTNTSLGNQVISNNCSSPSIVWTISPALGYTISSGSLGNDFSSTDPSLWLPGSDNLCVNFNIPGIYNITIKTGNKCDSVSITKTICIEPPLVPLFTVPASGCAPFAFSTTNTTVSTNQCTPPTYNWHVTYAPGSCGTSITPIPDQTSTNANFNFTQPGIYTIAFTATNSCTPSQTVTQTVTIKKPPTVTIASVTDFCQSATLTPSATINTCIPNTPLPTYLWTFPGGTSSSSTSTATPPLISYATAGNYSVSLAVTNECGTTTATSAIFNVLAAPIVQNETTSICSGTGFSVTPSPTAAGNSIPSGTTYSWPVPTVTGGITGGIAGTNQTSITGTLTNPTTIPQNATYTITPKIGTCNGITFTVIITINPSPTVLFSPAPQTVCSGDTSVLVTLSSAATGASFAWTAVQPAGITGVATSGTTTIPTQTLTNASNAPITITYNATATTSGGSTCAGALYPYTISVKPKPVINETFTPTVCSGTAFTIIPSTSAPNSIPTGTTYSWTAPTVTGGITGGASGNAQTVISGTLNNPTDIPQTATYSITPTTNGCPGNPFSITVTVTPKPIIANVTAASICSGATFTVTPANGGTNTIPAGTTYTWTVSSNSNITGQSASAVSGITSISQTLTNSSNTNQVLIYTVTPISGSCPGAPFTITITVNPIPIIANPPTPTICSGGTFTVAPTNGGGNIVPAGTNYTWTTPVSNPVGAITGGTSESAQTSISQQLTNNTNSPATLTYTVTPNSGNCPGTPFTITVTVDPIPGALSVTDQLYCNGIAAPGIVFTNVVTGTTYAWTNSNPAIGLPSSGTGDIPAFTPTNTGTGTITGIISVVPTFNGCSGPAQTFNINVISSPTVLFSPAPQSLCSGATSTVVALSSTATGASFIWSATQPLGVTGVILSGTNTIPPQILINSTNVPITVTYNATATTSSGSTCAGASYAYTITVKPLPSITEVFTTTSCSGDTFTITPSNSSQNSIPAGTTYTWSAPVVTGGMTGGASGNAQTTITGTLTNPTDSAQTATYNVTPLSDGCLGTPFSITLTVNPKPSIANVTPPDICSGETFIVTPAASGGNLIPLGTIYTWTISSNTSLTGQSASVGITSISQTLTNTTNTTQSITYTVTPISGSCPGNSFTVTVTVNPKPVISSVTPAAICSGDTFTVQPINSGSDIVPTGTTYTWTNPVSNPAGAITGGSAQTTAQTIISQLLTNTTNTIATLTYTVIPTSGSCPGDPFTITVTLSSKPVIAPKAATICSTTNFSVIPVNTGSDIVPTGTTYTWSTPTVNPIGSVTGAIAEANAQTSISQTLVNTTTNPATVTYTVTPTSGTCVGAAFTVTVTVNPSISPNVTVTNNSCFGVNIASITTNITGGIPFSSGTPYTISWTGPNGFTSTATSISNLAPGNYDVTIADAGGCPFSNTYTITEPAAIAITVDSENDITCFNAANGSITISVTGGTGAYVYTWTKDTSPYADVTQDIANLAPGVYIVSVTDANNCGPTTATFTITQPPLLVVSLVSQTNVLCFGAATGEIVVNLVGGTVGSGYTFSWTGPNSFTSSNQNLNAIVAGMYDLTVTDTNGCQKNLSVTITQSTDIVIAYTTTPITCYGADNASISVTLSGGNAPYQYQWSNLATTLNQTNLSAGNYTITVTDTVGCPKVETINIPQAPVFTVNPIVANISCFGAQNGSINLNLTGGITPVALTWSDGSTSGLIRNNLGPGTYTATISDGTPCFIVRTFTIVEPQPLILSANITNAFNCTNASSGAIDLIVAGGTLPYTYSWSNGSSTEDLSSITSGNYLVTVTDANGCIKTAQFPITRPDPIVLNVTTQTTFDCAAHTVDQNFVAQASGGIPAYQFQWSSGTISGANNEIMQSPVNGTVLLTVTDSYGCTATQTVVVDTPTLGYPSFDTTSIGYTTYGIYAIGDPITFLSTITGDYLSVSWDFGDGTFSTDLNPTHIYAIPKDYVVTQTVTYPFGCVYVQTITLIVEKGYLLVVPTAFTPNGDTINDTFRPVTKRLKNVRLDVYDTWGSIIYSETGDVLVGWDAKIKGFNAENGNYYAKVTGETFYGTVINENQTFVLIK